MKKIVLSVIVALIAITANAQVYVGGTFGVGSDKVETEGTEVRNTTFKILPEVGYELSEDWSVGTVVGYEYNKSGDVKTNTFTIAPYARYFFLNSDVVRLFADGGFGVSIRPRACFFPLFSFLPLWLHYNLNPLCVQY